MGSVGLLLAMIYGTLYRTTYKRLPAMLRTEGSCLSWKDILYAGALFIISLVLGLIVIL
jgi:hypothetical protein